MHTYTKKTYAFISPSGDSIMYEPSKTSCAIPAANMTLTTNKGIENFNFLYKATENINKEYKMHDII
jgi:hypothetical protein